MQEINKTKQENSAQSSWLKQFAITWTEEQRFFAKVLAKNKEEAYRLWQQRKDEICVTCQTDSLELLSGPFIEEVPDLLMGPNPVDSNLKGGEKDVC